MKILVTGGAGFIGSHIVDHYISLGHQVVVVDNLSTGKMEFVNPKARFYKLDICAPELEDIFKKERPDIINHQAAQVDLRKSVADPVCDVQVNVIGSLNIIQDCIKFGIKKIIFASSGGAVYGEPRSVPVPESHPRNPISPYGISKLTIEDYLCVINDYSPLDYTILRYANVYGPRQNPEGEAGVCAIFIGRMMNGLRCTLYGQGIPVRDYIYVEDIVEANVLAITKGSRGIYNLGTGIGTNVTEIWQLLQRLMGGKDKPEHKPLREGELEKIYLDCSKAKKELKWTPKVDLKEGLKKTIEYFKFKM